MMDALSGVLAYVVGPSIVTVGTAMAARAAARGSVKAAEVSAETNQEATAVSGYHQLVEDLRTDVTRLRQDHDSLREEHEDIRRHVKLLEDQALRDKSLIRHLVAYIRVLRKEISRLGGAVPEAPIGVEDRIVNVTAF